MPAAYSIDHLENLLVYQNLYVRRYSAESGDYLDSGHLSALEVSRGTISLSFSLDQLPGDVALISKDGSGKNAGQFTVWVKDGTLVITFEEDGETEYLKVPNLVLDDNQTYHFAMSFGPAGLQVWLDGQLVAAEPEFKEGLSLNDNSLVIGGSRAWQSSDDKPAHSLLKGEVGDVMVFDSQLSGADMIKLAGAVDPALGDAAKQASMLEGIAPVFDQLHHGSDTLKDILSEYGVSAHGHLMRQLDMLKSGNKADQSYNGGAGDDGINGNRGDDWVHGRNGDDLLQGGYGDDTLIGGNGDDILDGGHGNDNLRGGTGDDLLISRADAREPRIAYDPDRDEGDPLGELTSGKLYPDQPIYGNDGMTGGAGADIFYFQTLINAKKRYIEKHTRDDGTINWHGVAGENDKLHDHWVDFLGHETILDFNRAEGDRIVIEGHTTEIDAITYGDANGDGVMDHSIITLYSDQGSGGGAHNDDKLGSIKVYGDLVKHSDIEHTAAPAYGIIETVDDIKEAIAPADAPAKAKKFAPKASDLPTAAELGLTNGPDPVYAITGTHQLDAESGDYLDSGHLSALEVSRGTISLSFSLDQLPGDVALISKDGSGKNAGQFTVWVKDGTLVITFEEDGETEYLKVPNLVLDDNQTYHFAMSFGPAGLQVWLDGQLVAAEPEFKEGLSLNDNSLVIGGSRAWQSSDDKPAHSLLKGEVGDVMVFDSQLSGADMIKLAGAVDPALGDAAKQASMLEGIAPVFDQLHHGSDTLKDILSEYGVSAHGHLMRQLDMLKSGNKADQSYNGGAGDDGINGNRGDDWVHGRNGDDLLQGGYGDDTLIGGNGDDILDGGHGNDNLRGGTGDDLLISRADAREPRIAYDPDRDEGDPLGELTSGKLYPDQPIYGNDGMTGGAGADIFYFQTLINAKKRYIEKHTRDDGTINWHGVAGENDKLHDHWVDFLGHETILDFNRAEGDRIVIEGHTTEIDAITYGDANGDGVMDHSIITLYSDQGSGGGAHNDDKLGSIKVYGDLVKHSDIEHTAAPAYGIIETVDDIKEAIAPADAPAKAKKFAPKASDLPTAAELGYSTDKVPALAAPGVYAFFPNDRAPLEFAHDAALDLNSATVALTFEVDGLGGYQTLFSKDALGNGAGGHVTAYINDEADLVVRLQDTEDSHYFVVEEAIEAGKSYDFVLNFGPNGAELNLNGVRVAYDTEISVGWGENTEALIVGASGWSNTPGKTDNIHSHFHGTIYDFAVFQGTLSTNQLFGPAPRDDHAYFAKTTQSYRFYDGPDGGVVVTHKDQSWTTDSSVDFLTFSDGSFRVEDFQFGGTARDTLKGGDGADVLLGAGASDYLLGYDNDDVLRGGGGKDTLSGGDGLDRLYGDQHDDKIYGGDGNDLISGGTGDDTLVGGNGNDRFYGGLGDDLIFGSNWDEAGLANRDRVHFDGNFADYSFETVTFYHSGRNEYVSQLIVTDSAGGGQDGFYEGRDRLMDIDLLIFADQTVSFDNLI